MDIAELFEGLWTLERRVEDARAGETHVFTGQAAFARIPGGLSLSERGTWRAGPHAGLGGTRRYLWRAAGPGRVEVRHADGRPFHVFTVGPDASCAVVHECDPDLYEGEYAFRLPGVWRLDWRVRGPRKDYASRSVFRREARAGLAGRDPMGQDTADLNAKGESGRWL